MWGILQHGLSAETEKMVIKGEKKQIAQKRMPLSTAYSDFRG